MSGPTKKSEFRNTRDHHIGVVVKREDGKMKGIALAPGAPIWMDEEEQMATANAPRSDTDNPFTNGDLELVQSARALANRRPIGDTEHPQQVTGGQVAETAPPAAEPGAVGAGSDDEEGSAPADADAEPQADAGDPGQRLPSKEDQEASARAASARRRAPAANEASTPPPAPPGGHTGSTPTPKGDAPEGKSAPAEEVGTPQAVPSE